MERSSEAWFLRSVRGNGRGRVLLVLALGWFVALGLRYFVPAILPQIKTEFRVGDGTAGVAVTVIWACYAIAQFPAGALVDRLGERVLLTASLCVTALSLVVFALSPFFTAFLLGCAVLGLGTGLYGPARGVALSRVFVEGRSVAFGATLAAGSIGSATIPVLASLVVDRIDWHLSVLAVVPVALVLAISLWRTVPSRTADGENTEKEATGGAATDHGTAEDAATDGGTPDVGFGAVLAAVSNRRVLVATLAVTFMLFTYQGLTAFLPTYLAGPKGLSSASASGLYALLFLAGAGFQLLSGRATDRYGSKVTLLALSAIGALSLAALPFTNGLFALVVLVVVLSTRLGANPVSNSYIIDGIADEVQGTAWGLVRTCFFLVASLGSTFVGALSDRGYFDTAFLALAGLTAVAFLLFWLLPEE